MNYSVLEKCSLFRGVPLKELIIDLESVTYHVANYDKEETIFRLMEPASRIGIILKGRVQAQKTFRNGSQGNVSVFKPGELIGPAAVFSSGHKYPCDIVALEPATIMMLLKEDVIVLMQKDSRIMENLVTQIASATYMLQQRLELLSYSGIAQKAAFYLLMQARQTGRDQIMIPGSISKWALLMNVSRPSLHRELKKLEAQGMISYAPPVIKILDRDALQNVLG